jgi:chromosome segregation ATPase
MQTLFGKILIFAMVLISLGAVGIATWLTVDARDFAAENKAILQEYSNRVQRARMDGLALARAMHELEQGKREMPWDIEAQLFGGKVKSVSETKRDLSELDKDINKLSDDKNTKVDTRNSLLDEIKKQRDETEKALAEQKRLREVITPDPAAQPGAKSFRDRMDDYRTAKAAAEEQQEKIRPELDNERVRVSILLDRRAELEKRLAELKGQSGGAQP